MLNWSTTLIGLSKRIGFLLILMLIWELAYRLGVDLLKVWQPYIFPSPGQVADTLAHLFADGTMLFAIQATLGRLLLGYALSVVVGSLIGLLMARFKYLEENLRPIVMGLQTLPNICWVPFAILWFGLSDRTILFVIVMGSAFSIAMALDAGIRNINPLYIKAARTMGVSGPRLVRHVLIPAALPALMTGLKQGWSFAWRGLMAGEMLVATKGLGQVLMMGRELADISQVLAVMLVIIALGMGTEQLVFQPVENRLQIRWGLKKPA